MINKPITRGDIVFVNFGEHSGSVQYGYRPAVVLQRDRYNKSSETTIVAPLTTVIKRSGMVTHVYIGKRFGLPERSMLLLEQIQTIDKSAIDTWLGHIDDEDLFCKINRGLRKVLAIKSEELDPSFVLKRPRLGDESVEKKKRKKKKPSFSQRDIMCLCPVCRDSYRHRGFRVIRAGDTKDICDLCNYRTGFDYAVVGLLTR